MSVTSLRLQFRIQSAYGLTIHKAQGLTLDQVVIDLDFGTFKPAGAAYVALSRARSLEGVSPPFRSVIYQGQQGGGSVLQVNLARWQVWLRRGTRPEDAPTSEPM